MQFFASVSYIKPFFLILVSLCVVMFQCLSDVVLFHDLSLPFARFLSFPFFHGLSHSIFPSPCSQFCFLFFFFYHIVKLTPSPVTTHYAVLTKHSKYTSKCLYVYYCVAQVSAWQSRNKPSPKNCQTGSWKSSVLNLNQNSTGKKKHISWVDFYFILF